MTHAEIATMISRIGLPYAYHHFPDSSGQQPPFICFAYPQNDDLIADNMNYCRIDQLTVDLYTDNKDFTLENQVETTLTNAGFVWSKSETYISEERMYCASYTTEVLINE